MEREMVILVSLLLLNIGANTCTQECQDNKYCHLLDTVQSQLNQLKEKLKELSYSPPLPESCAEIMLLESCSPSSTGYYEILVDGDSEIVYCNMDDELCGENGGWMRVGHLNMTNSNETCPAEFQTYNINGTRSCGRSSMRNCQSVMLPSHGVNYTQVCGRVTGYQKGTPDAFIDTNLTGQRGNIELAYVDGVSITRGSSPRNHIWTYAAVSREIIKRCPCDEGASDDDKALPSFVGEAEYFCESASELTVDVKTFYTEDLLWDGKQCGDIQAACCQASSNMPWFKKVLDTPSTDYLELRVCCDQELDNEDVAVNFFEIYIK